MMPDDEASSTEADTLHASSSTDAHTLRDWLAREPYTLVLSSSFFGFYAHIGVLAALLEAGLPPSAVAGSSAGALVTALWAAGMEPQQMYSCFDEAVKERGSLRPAVPWREPGGVLSAAHIVRRLKGIIEELGLATRLERCRVPSSVSVFDLRRLSARALHEGPLAEAVAASMAVPAMFAPVYLDGRPHLDGGLGDMPGVLGVPPQARILYHHATIWPQSLTPLHAGAPEGRRPTLWRPSQPRAPATAHTSSPLPGLAAGAYEASVTLQILDLPMLHPLRLEPGLGAFQAAKQATAEALARPLGARPEGGSGWQRLTMRAKL